MLHVDVRCNFHHHFSHVVLRYHEDIFIQVRVHKCTRNVKCSIEPFSNVLMAAVVNTDSVATVGDAASSFKLYSLCELPSMQCLLFNLPSRFSLKNMSDDSALIFQLSSFVGSLGRQVSMTCSCVNSVMAVSLAHASKSHMPALR